MANAAGRTTDFQKDRGELVTSGNRDELTGIHAPTVIPAVTTAECEIGLMRYFV